MRETEQLFESAPAAWAQKFAATLRRVYPSTPEPLAASIAKAEYAKSYYLDPFYPAEVYALAEGGPPSAERS